MLVSVTQDHIDRGERGNGYRCAIALALNEQLPDGYHCEVTGWSVYFYGETKADRPGATTTCDTSEVMSEFIERYDDRRDLFVKPHTFNLPVKKALKELGYAD